MNYMVMYMLAVGLLLTGFGLSKIFKRKQYKRSGIKVDGIVSDIVASGRNYYPIVSYETLDGVEVVEEYPLGTSPSAFRKGERIAVFYKQENCKKFIIDAKKSEYIEFAFVAVGLLVVVIAGFYLVGGTLF